MESVAKRVSDNQKKKAVVDVRSGDTVRVHQKIREGGKERIQVFEGLVIKASRKDSLTSTFTVRRIASGIGVEKSFLIHSPNILKVEVVRRSKVRRNYLTYMRQLTGKSARLSGVDFDREAVNAIHDKAAEAEEERIHEEQVEAYDPAAAKAEKEELEAEAAAATAEEPKSEAEKIESQPKERAEAEGPAAGQNKE
ncbi:MAG TPA: 50S ribosomal protein L19 [Candidatus Saccharimonadales bacterium]|nr:50S ribosomal protein L19 [Candidatus Saccharimonadales bacterium]